MTLDFSRPGKPTDNAFIEAFNGRFRAECLNAHWFLTLADARKKLEDWRRYYNEERPHGAIGHKTADHVAESRWRSQPATVKEPENSTLRRSRKWSHCTLLSTRPSFGGCSHSYVRPAISLDRSKGACAFHLREGRSS